MTPLRYADHATRSMPIPSPVHISSVFYFFITFTTAWCQHFLAHFTLLKLSHLYFFLVQYNDAKLSHPFFFRPTSNIEFFWLQWIDKMVLSSSVLMISTEIPITVLCHKIEFNIEKHWGIRVTIIVALTVELRVHFSHWHIPQLNFLSLLSITI